MIEDYLLYYILTINSILIGYVVGVILYFGLGTCFQSETKRN